MSSFHIIENQLVNWGMLMKNGEMLPFLNFRKVFHLDIVCVGVQSATNITQQKKQVRISSLQLNRLREKKNIVDGCFFQKPLIFKI